LRASAISLRMAAICCCASVPVRVFSL